MSEEKDSERRLRGQILRRRRCGTRLRHGWEIVSLLMDRIVFRNQKDSKHTDD